MANIAQIGNKWERKALIKHQIPVLFFGVTLFSAVRKSSSVDRNIRCNYCSNPYWRLYEPEWRPEHKCVHSNTTDHQPLPLDTSQAAVVSWWTWTSNSFGRSTPVTQAVQKWHQIWKLEEVWEKTDLVGPVYHFSSTTCSVCLLYTSPSPRD